MPLSPALGLHALLGTGPSPLPGGQVPPLWHWLYFLRWPASDELGPDGHPLTGGFFPPLRDRRRTFAGGRAGFGQPLRFGESARMTSTLLKAEVKHGRSGELLLVTVRSEITQHDRVCVVEEQDFAYRSGPVDLAGKGGEGRMTGPATRASSVQAGEARSARRPDPVTLFRFSALTANSHRIHYDETYARDTEGYPGLLTQGPLLAVLMAEELRVEASPPIRSVSYKVHRPVFAGEEISIAVTAADNRSEVAVRGAAQVLRASAVFHHDHPKLPA
jgi:3-methylfumaryl-CoA hydratase